MRRWRRTRQDPDRPRSALPPQRDLGDGIGSGVVGKGREGVGGGGGGESQQQCFIETAAVLAKRNYTINNARARMTKFRLDPSTSDGVNHLANQPLMGKVEGGRGRWGGGD